ncbi:MAG: hypothetical protein IPI50_07530 [Saprospiraceae bacterium]|nr:hypothetical protein [Saprospiraceae bacterium]
MKKETEKKGLLRIGSGLPVFNSHAAGIDIGIPSNVLPLMTKMEGMK